jgi:hypothetical protein
MEQSSERVLIKEVAVRGFGVSCRFNEETLTVSLTMSSLLSVEPLSQASESGDRAEAS